VKTIEGTWANRWVVMALAIASNNADETKGKWVLKSHTQVNFEYFQARI
jgi:hypothetical protein